MKILILCTGNSCRSQMAHGFLQSFDNAIEVHSAGTKPAGNVPLYLEIGEQIRLSNGESGYIICHSLITKKWNEDRDYLYPVPISERTLSNGVITQNPGWNDGLNFN